MNFMYENDYIMRIIQEMVRIMVSLMLGKQYVQAESPQENKYGVSDLKLQKWRELIDSGKINEGENELLENMDYQSKEDVAEAIFFYEYAGEKGDKFLREHDYSIEEVLDGLKQLAMQSGYGDLMEMLVE